MSNLRQSHNFNHVRLFISTFILLILLSGCQQFNARKSVNINDEVIHHQKKLMLSLDNFVKALEEKDNAAINDGIAALQNISSEGIAAVEMMTSPVCDQQFIPAARIMFEHYNHSAKNNYKAISNLYILDSISYEEYDSLQVLVDKFKAEQQSVNNAFTSAQKIFAKNCSFKLVKYAK